MKRTKTNKKIFTIFNAILGVVFAFLVGVTYCATSLNLIYGTKNVSTNAFMGNQQFHLINDTDTNPVPFGPGAHNFEVALQYSFDYSFDLRIKYSLSWSNGKSVDNVILNFTNRDNIIYDTEYIYLANPVPAGSGKLTLITGVEFVDSTSSEYDGAQLEININNSDIKIYKAQETYETSHLFVKNLLTFDSKGNVLGPKDPEDETGKTLITPYTPSAHAWWQYKQIQTTTGTRDSYAMVYNYRRNYAHGIPYPGLDSAYKKPAVINKETITTGENESQKTVELQPNHIYAPVWTGGNRAYAGTGLYIITGSSAVEVEVQVAGIWRTSGQVELSSENNFQYNYETDWNFEEYSDDHLWEIRTFKYYFPAESSFYVDILNSIEITSAGEVVSTEYRLVTNKIVVNSTTFSYGEATDDYIQVKQLASTSTDYEATPARTDYSLQDRSISVVNTTIYSNGLFDTFGNNVSSQRYNGNITLINNTSETRNVRVGLDLYYHISNGQSKLYNSNYERAADVIKNTTGLTYKSPFNSGDLTSAVNTLYYSYTSETDNLYFINNETPLSEYTIQLAPYASANLVSTYDVKADLSEDILTAFNDPTTTNRNEYYDVWTYLVPNVSSEEVKTPTYSNLTLETTQTNSETIVSVKNNTNQKITGISIEDLTVRKTLDVSYTQSTSDYVYDWSVNYWKYYSKSEGSSIPDTQVTQQDTEYEKNKYWLKSQSYSNETITQSHLATGFTMTTTTENGNTNTIISNLTKELLPGESVQVATIATTLNVNVSGKVTTSSLEDLTGVEIINNGTASAYIVNYTENDYYLRFSGSATGTNIELIDGYNYYIGIVRAKQIINLSMTVKGEITENDKILVEGDYDSSVLTSQETYAWSTNAAARFTNYFNINKK